MSRDSTLVECSRFYLERFVQDHDDLEAMVFSHIVPSHLSVLWVASSLSATCPLSCLQIFAFKPSTLKQRAMLVKKGNAQWQ